MDVFSAVFRNLVTLLLRWVFAIGMFFLNIVTFIIFILLGEFVLI